MALDATDIRVEIQGTATDLRLAARSAVREIRDVGQEARRQSLLARAGTSQNLAYANSYDDVRVKVGGAAQGIRNFSTSWRAVGWASLLGNIGPLTAGLQDLAAAGVAAGSAVAPLAGLAASIPYGFGVAGQAATVLAVAFHGVQKALEGDKDALAALDPEQRKLVRLIRDDLTPEVQKLQDTVQKGFLPGFDRGLERALTVAPVVQKVLGDTARAMGDLSAQAGGMLADKQVQRDLQRFGETNVTLLRDLGDGGLHLADAMRHVTAAAEPLTLHLGDLFDEGARLLDQWAAAERRSGGLADFFDLTSTRVDQSLSILGDAGGVLAGLFTASQPLANGMMSGLVGDMDRLHKIVGSPQGQRELAGFFEQARQPLGEVWHLAGDLVVDLGKLGVASQDELGRLARVLRTDALPALNDLATTVSQDVMPNLVDLAGDLANLAREVEPGLKPVVGLAGDLADALGNVVDVTADVTHDLPGVAKLIPTLAVGGTVLLSWRRLRDLMGGLPSALRAGATSGAVGAPARIAPDLLAGRGTPTNPLYVIPLTGGLPGTGAPVPAGGRPGVAGERRTAGGVILPPGVEPPARALPRTTRVGQKFNRLVPVLSGSPYTIMAMIALSDAVDIANAQDKGAAVEGKLKRNVGIASFLTDPGRIGTQLGAKLGRDLFGGSISVQPGTGASLQDAARWLRDLKPTALVGWREELKKLQALGDSDGLRKLAARMRDVAKSTDDTARKHALRDLAQDAQHLATVTRALDPLNQQLDRLRRQGDTRGMAQLADHARALAKEFPDATTELHRFAGQVDSALQRQVEPDFRRMQQVAGLSMDRITRTVRATTRDIKTRLGQDTAAGKDALAHNMQLAVAAIQQSMKYGQTSTEKGLAEIRRLLTQELALYGITGKQAKRYLSGQDTLGAGGPIGTGNEGHQGINFRAQGGLHDLGRPGTPGRDRIPMLLNGQPVIAAEGESIAVLTRHQRASLDRLAAEQGYGGLRGFIRHHDRPNYMAQGGLVEAAMGADMGAGGGDRPLSFFADLARREGLVVTSGRRSPAENAAAGGAAGSFHLTGQAIDVSGTPGLMMAYAREVAGNYGRQLEELFYDPLGFYIKYGRRIPGAIGGHGDHVHVAETGGPGLPGGVGLPAGGTAAAAAVRPWEDIKAPATDMGGVVGQIVQAALNRATAAANQRGQQLTGAGTGGGLAGSTYEGPLDRVFPPGVRLSEAQVRRLLDAGGMGFMPMYIPIRESGLQPGVIGDDAAKGYGHTFGYGLLQVTTGVNGPEFEQVVQSLGGWRQMLNPVKNIIAAKWLSEHAASPLAPWSATAATGLLLDAVLAATGLPPIGRAADTGDTIIGLGDPKAPDTASKPKPKAKRPKQTEAARKRSARKTPATSGPGRPDLSKARARARRKTRVKPIPQWIRDLAIPEGKEALANLRDYETLFEQPIAHLQAVIGNMDADMALSVEEPTVTLYDSAQYRDLTQWLAQHPEDLAGAKTPAEFIDKYGNGLDVVNQAGMNVQGRFVRGISQRADEIRQLLAQHTSTPDGSGQGGLLGLMLGYLTETTMWGPAALNLAGEVTGNYLHQLRVAYAARREDRQHERAKLKALDRKSITASERVAQLEAQRDMLRQYKEDIARAAIGHRLTDQGKENRQWATDKISDLTREIGELQMDGAGPLLKGRPRRPTGKRATPEALARYREDLADWQRRQRRFARLYAKTQQAVGFDERVMDRIAGHHTGAFTPEAGSVAGGWVQRRQDIREHRDEYRATAVRLADTDIPAERLAIKTLQGELGDLLATRIQPPPLDTTSNTVDNSQEIARLLAEQRDEARRQARIADAQFAALTGFAPLAGQRLLGSYKTGTDYVPQDGPYRLHRGEMVLPEPVAALLRDNAMVAAAPAGPAPAAAAAAAPAAAPVVNVYLDAEGVTLRQVRAEIDGRAAHVVSQQQGRRARLIAAAPGAR